MNANECAQIKEYTEATGTKEQLLALIHICQSMHAVFLLPENAANVESMVSCELNLDGYNESYIDELLQKLSEKN